ncbi:MAG: prephenate dehydratase [Spirochaetes bacterium]|nr:prephenate dehydratase [Spirochaetota bacterium]
MSDKDELSKIDREIIRLVSRRAGLYVEALKKLPPEEAFDAAHRGRTFALIDEMNPSPLTPGIMKKMYLELFSGCLAAISPVTVAFLGPEGTFTGIAVHEFLGESIEGLPQRTIQDVFRKVEAGAARFGVVPVENSTEGSVTYTLDELVETSLQILSERYVRITYSLLSREKDSAAITRVYSHPQSLGQCKAWLRANLPGVAVEAADSTSTAAEIASREAGAAAIASSNAGALYGLNTLASMLEDSRQNYTRFFLVGNGAPEPTGSDKTSIVCAVKDSPGALLALLTPFSNAGINMMKIESRPDKKKIWEYNFFIDFAGHRDDAAIRDALEKMRREAIFLKILGSYPAGG